MPPRNPDDNRPLTPSGQRSRATGAERHSFPPRAEKVADRVWSVRLTEAEEEVAQAALKASGLSRSDWMRRVLCGG